MNIYPYIPSPDISAYCEKIGHDFQNLDMATIIAMSGLPISKKHAAWRELIAEYPDCQVQARLNFDAQESLHDYLGALIEHEEKKIATFYTPNYGEVFRFGVMWSDANGCWNDDDGTYSTFDKAWAALWKEYEVNDIIQVKVDKVQIDSDNSAHTAYMNTDGELLSLDIYTGGNSPRGLDMIFIDLPVPFLRGDIVTVGDGEPRVLADLHHWWDGNVNYEGYCSGKFGDGSDMIPYFYFIDESGTLFRDHTSSHDLWELQYFRGELKGQDRFLKYLSQYIKTGNSDDIAWLFNVFLKLRAESESDELNRLFGGWYRKLIDEDIEASE